MTSAEQAIRASVASEPETGGPRAVTYMIRALECRRTLCFVETAAIEGVHSKFFSFERANSLKAGYSMDGWETKDDGTQLTISPTPFVRK